MRKKIIIAAFAILLINFNCFAQKANNFKLNNVEFTKVNGAGKYSNPKIIKGKDNKYIYVEKSGHSTPNLYDWNKDGKLDLLVGEFGGGYSANLAVFINIGTSNNPIYSNELVYATDKKGAKLNVLGA